MDTAQIAIVLLPARHLKYAEIFKCSTGNGAAHWDNFVIIKSAFSAKPRRLKLSKCTGKSWKIDFILHLAKRVPHPKDVASSS